MKNHLQILLEKKVKEEFKEHETRVSEKISNNLHNTSDGLDKISKEMTEQSKILEFTQDQSEVEINNIKENIKHLGFIQTNFGLKESKMIFWIQMTYLQD